MATKRMKRIKRTKIHLHHGRRKTNRRHLRNATRRGGMLKWAAKTIGSEVLNRRGGLLYDGIEVFKVMVDGNPRYYIGNKPILEYEQSKKLDDQQYGRKIMTNLLGIDTSNQFVTVGGPFDGVYYLNQDGFDQFKDNFTSPSDIKLQRIGKKMMYLHFLGKKHILKPDTPLEIDIQPNPSSRENPVNKLKFLATLDDKITVEFVLKKNPTTYCAMARYDERHHYLPSQNEEFNYENPSITKSLVLSFKTNKIDIFDQIIPVIDEIHQYANECADDPETMESARGYYTGHVRSAHIPKGIEIKL